MKTVIIRNIERLITNSHASDRERIEPMSAYKWQRLYDIAVEYGILPWITDGIQSYSDDFFLQIPDNVRNDILANTDPKNPENLSRFQLYVERTTSLRQKLSRHSLQAYAQDIIQKITNIEE